MRLLIIVLSVLVGVEVAMAQTAVGTVKASDQSVSRGGIFDPRSSLEITLNPIEIDRLLGTNALDKEVADKFRDLEALSKTVDIGQKNLKLVAMNSRDQTAINAVAGSFVEIERLAKKFGYWERINARIDASPEVNPIYLTEIYLRGAQEIANDIRTSLIKTVPTLRVKLVLSRDPDSSRQPEKPFGVLPGRESKDALGGFLTSLNLTSDPGEVTPLSLRDALVRQFRNTAQTRYEQFKGKADGLFDAYKVRIDLIVAGSAEPGKTEWTAIAADLVAAKSTWEQLRVDAVDLFATSPSNQAEWESFVTRAGQLLSQAKTLEAKLIAVKAKVDLSLRSVSPGVRITAEQLSLTVSEAVKEANALVNEGLKLATSLLNSGLELLNLRDLLVEIGSTFKDSERGFVRFQNRNQQLEGLPPIRSYDEVRIEVFRIAEPGGKPEPVGDSYSIYAWKPGRLDTITALGFYPRAGSDKWYGAVILGQAYKFTNSRASFQTNRFVYPGLGYSLISLDQNGDGQTEVGVGAMLTLFDDHIVGGFGYNTSGLGTYWYIGYRFRL